MSNTVMFPINDLSVIYKLWFLRRNHCLSYNECSHFGTSVDPCNEIFNYQSWPTTRFMEVPHVCEHCHQRFNQSWSLTSWSTADSRYCRAKMPSFSFRGSGGSMLWWPCLQGRWPQYSSCCMPSRGSGVGMLVAAWNNDNIEIRLYRQLRARRALSP